MNCLNKIVMINILKCDLNKYWWGSTEDIIRTKTKTNWRFCYWMTSYFSKCPLKMSKNTQKRKNEERKICFLNNDLGQYSVEFSGDYDRIKIKLN